ncbi:Ferredoxin-type protein NapF [subsurface metagenome]
MEVVKMAVSNWALYSSMGRSLSAGQLSPLLNDPYYKTIGIGTKIFLGGGVGFVIRNEERCTHCGACITICPTGAFELDPITRWVNFHDEKCLACGLCIKACPPRAMEVHF